MARAKSAADLNGHARFGQINREVGHLAHHEHTNSALAKLMKKAFAFVDGGRSRYLGHAQGITQFGQLIQVLTDHENAVIGMRVDQLAHDRKLRWAGSGQPISIFV
ncbi:unannotated protein [freshwater metagenome]|uniref:Unannotated protein n=1 Tax=freshwater metagenome TaxID=449393 RepID=A0A6J7G0V9_9ZZZZ